jgi:hypothetical protein
MSLPASLGSIRLVVVASSNRSVSTYLPAWARLGSASSTVAISRQAVSLTGGSTGTGPCRSFKQADGEHHLNSGFYTVVAYTVYSSRKGGIRGGGSCGMQSVSLQVYINTHEQRVKQRVSGLRARNMI